MQRGASSPRLVASGLYRDRINGARTPFYGAAPVEALDRFFRKHGALAERRFAAAPGHGSSGLPAQCQWVSTAFNRAMTATGIHNH